jgi:hypothetical protein
VSCPGAASSAPSAPGLGAPAAVYSSATPGNPGTVARRARDYSVRPDDSNAHPLAVVSVEDCNGCGCYRLWLQMDLKLCDSYYSAFFHSSYFHIKFFVVIGL